MLHHRSTLLRARGADGAATPFGLGALGLTAAALAQQPLPHLSDSAPQSAVAAAYLAARAAADERAALARARAAQPPWQRRLAAAEADAAAAAAASGGGRCFGDSLALRRCGAGEGAGAAGAVAAAASRAAAPLAALEAARGLEW